MIRSSTRVLRPVCALTGAVVFASAAHAGFVGHRWEEVDNSTLRGGAASGLNNGAFNGKIYRTFDLFIIAPQGMLIADSGFTQSQGPNPGLTLSNSSYLQLEPFGSPNDKRPTEGAINAAPIIEFDSWVTLGDLAPATVGLIGFSFNTTSLIGTWFSGGTVAAPTENGEVLIARFTVESALGFGVDESADRFLGGQMFIGLAGDVGGIVTISNAFALGSTPTIPAPGGAIALLALAGGVFGSRRRG